MAAMLHDTVEDTDTTLEEIAREFGEEVASIVDVSLDSCLGNITGIPTSLVILVPGMYRSARYFVSDTQTAANRYCAT